MLRNLELCLNGLSKRGFDKRLLMNDWESIELDVSKKPDVNKKFKSATSVMQTYIKNYTGALTVGGGLAIVGGSGCGKSLLVNLLVKDLWMRYSVTAHTTTCDDIFKSVNSMWNDADKFQGVYINTPFLVVDNVPSTLHQSRSVFPPLEALLRSRIRASRPTVFVCNISHEALASFPPTLISLMQEAMLFVDLDGVPDFRPRMNSLLKKVVGI